ncbi:hypothetical protein [Pseudoclavibacter helvolus]|uniref:hypothetical protein n=1 Tax=Pseudoclavibacter helvolus TaxID=255205 RepID=UPI003C7408B5
MSFESVVVVTGCVVAAVLLAFGVLMLVAPRAMARRGLPRSYKAGGHASVGYTRLSGGVLCGVAVATAVLSLAAGPLGLL